MRTSHEPLRRSGLRVRSAALLLAVLVAGTVAAGASSAPDNGRDPCSVGKKVGEPPRCRTPGPTGTQPTPSSQGQVQAASLPEQQPRVVSTTPRFVADRLLVTFQLGTTPARRREVFSRAGVTPIGRIGGIEVYVVQVAPGRRDAALAALRASPAVAVAGKDAVIEALDVTPNDTDWSMQWGLRQIGLPKAWATTRGSASVTVALLDTGVDASHPDLAGATLLPGFNLLDAEAPPRDDNGHGTAVAGVVAARTDNHQGIAGICWSCTILPIKVLAADGTGDSASVAAGIVRAADAGAQVISMSLGTPYDDPTLTAAVDYARSKNALLVAAAGNNGSTTPFYPAADPSVVGVAATDQTDRLYPWSDSGSWVALAAPGCNAAPAPGGTYESFCGTSSATPVVAGLIALELSAQPQADRGAVVAAIERTAVPVAGVADGRVDAAAALAQLVPPPIVAPTPTSILSASGSLTRRAPARAYRVAVPAGLVSVRLSFRGASRLSLVVLGRRGTAVMRVSGASPLRLSRQLPAGRFTIAIRGRPRPTVRFTIAGLAGAAVLSAGARPQ